VRAAVAASAPTDHLPLSPRCLSVSALAAAREVDPSASALGLFLQAGIGVDGGGDDDRPLGDEDAWKKEAARLILR
jgi:hypothetical protein